MSSNQRWLLRSLSAKNRLQRNPILRMKQPTKAILSLNQIKRLNYSKLRVICSNIRRLRSLFKQLNTIKIYNFCKSRKYQLQHFPHENHKFELSQKTSRQMKVKSLLENWPPYRKRTHLSKLKHLQDLWKIHLSCRLNLSQFSLRGIALRDQTRARIARANMAM